MQVSYFLKAFIFLLKLKSLSHNLLDCNSSVGFDHFDILGFDTSKFRLFIIELTHSKTILENTVQIQPQPVASDFKNLSQYSSRSK